MDLHELQVMRREDFQIDADNLIEENSRLQDMRTKYLDLHDNEKLKLLSLKREMEKLYRDAYEFYTHGPDKSNRRGWAEDEHPSSGLILLKKDVEKYINADRLVQELQEKVDYAEVLVASLDATCDAIHQRHFVLQNIMKEKHFRGGVI